MKDVSGVSVPFESLDTAYSWMYDHLLSYIPFNKLIKECRGTAVSLNELAEIIFPDISRDKALEAVGVLLAIAPMAKNRKGATLFPVRMHMLFRGIKGIYACTNPDCKKSCSDGALTLGDIYLKDGQLTCGECGSMVYELYNDRRCGALFFKGYISTEDLKKSGVEYLWHYPSQFKNKNLKEIHLFIPDKNFILEKTRGKYQIKPCYLDSQSGFVYFRDDSMNGKPGIRKLYYSNYEDKGNRDVITFYSCPHCKRQLSLTKLTSFKTRGNQAFNSLITSQFQAEPPC